MRCPVCDFDMDTPSKCQVCGFAESSAYERHLSISEIPEDAVTIAGKINQFEIEKKAISVEEYEKQLVVMKRMLKEQQEYISEQQALIQEQKEQLQKQITTTPTIPPTIVPSKDVQENNNKIVLPKKDVSSQKDVFSQKDVPSQKERGINIDVSDVHISDNPITWKIAALSGLLSSGLFLLFFLRLDTRGTLESHLPLFPLAGGVGILFLFLCRDWKRRDGSLLYSFLKTMEVGSIVAYIVVCYFYLHN